MPFNKVYEVIGKIQQQASVQLSEKWSGKEELILIIHPFKVFCHFGAQREI